MRNQVLGNSRSNIIWALIYSPKKTAAFHLPLDTKYCSFHNNFYPKFYQINSLIMIINSQFINLQNIMTLNSKFSNPHIYALSRKEKRLKMSAVCLILVRLTIKFAQDLPKKPLIQCLASQEHH
jgi:hypothetical protein